MNILFVASCAPRPHTRRYGSFVHDIARVLAEYGNQVSVLVPIRIFPDQQLARACLAPWQVAGWLRALRRWVALWYGAKGVKEYDGVRYVYVRYVSSPAVSRTGRNGVFLVARFSRWWPRIEAFLAQTPPAVLVGHFLDMAPLVDQIGKMYRARRFVYVHEYPLMYGCEWGKHGVRDAVCRVDGLLCSAEANREALKEAGYTAVPSACCPLPLCKQIPQRKRWKKEGQTRPLCLLYVARFSPNKRHDVLLQVVGRWTERYPEIPVRLLLLGDDGPALPSVLSAVQGLRLGARVEVRLYQSEADWQQSIQEADLFVSPSAYESYGLAMCEAAAAGIPVVAYKRAGFVKEYGAHKGAILPVSKLDVDAFVQAIAWYVQHEEESQVAAARLAAVVQANMSPDACYARWRCVLGLE